MNHEQAQIEERLRSFYRERLLQLADLAAKNGVEFFPLGPASEIESYYTDRTDDGNYIHEIDSANIAGELKTMWKNGSIPELSEIADELVELTDLLQEKEETSDEVSPFIYAMF